MSQATTQVIEHVKKITIKGLGAVRRDLTPGQRVEVARLAGVVTGYKTAITQYGTSYGLIGTFRAACTDGRIVASNVLYGAGGFENEIVAALDAGAQNIEFGVIVYATGIEAKAGGSNYMWSFAPFIKPAESSPAANLLARAADIPVLKLSAPPAESENPAESEKPAAASK